MTKINPWCAIRLCVLVLLAGVLIFVAHSVGSIIVDGFQSLGAVSDSSAALDLHWPLVGDYLEYDKVWGFHWPGWPLLRSLHLPVLPWAPLLELCLLGFLWAATAWIISKLARRTWSAAWSAGLGLLCLMAPGIVVTLQNYRPEVITALLLLLVLWKWSATRGSDRAIILLTLILLPLIHPLGFVVPGAWLAWDFLHIARRDGLVFAVKVCVAKATALILGVLLFVAWFAVQSAAWVQFQTNLEAQRLLSQGMGINHYTFFRWMFGSFTALPLLILVLTSVMVAINQCFRNWQSSNQLGAYHSLDDVAVRAGVGVIAAIFFNWVIKNTNAHHLVAVLPLMIWLSVSGVRQFFGRWHPSLPVVVCIIMFLMANALMGKYALALWRNEGRSYRGSVSEALNALPPARKVWIPVAFWEAAQIAKREGKTLYQFSTFPNVIASLKREDYERQVLSDLQAGDLLIWDPLQEKGGVFNFVTETALRHRLIHPESQTYAWDRLPDIHIPVQYSRGQAVDFQVYRKK